MTFPTHSGRYNHRNSNHQRRTNIYAEFNAQQHTNLRARNHLSLHPHDVRNAYHLPETQNELTQSKNHSTCLSNEFDYYGGHGLILLAIGLLFIGLSIPLAISPLFFLGGIIMILSVPLMGVSLIGNMIMSYKSKDSSAEKKFELTSSQQAPIHIPIRLPRVNRPLTPDFRYPATQPKQPLPSKQKPDSPSADIPRPFQQYQHQFPAEFDTDDELKTLHPYSLNQDLNPHKFTQAMTWFNEIENPVNLCAEFVIAHLADYYDLEKPNLFIHQNQCGINPITGYPYTREYITIHAHHDKTQNSVNIYNIEQFDKHCTNVLTNNYNINISNGMGHLPLQQTIEHILKHPNTRDRLFLVWTKNLYGGHHMILHFEKNQWVLRCHLTQGEIPIFDAHGKLNAAGQLVFSEQSSAQLYSPSFNSARQTIADFEAERKAELHYKDSLLQF